MGRIAGTYASETSKIAHKRAMLGYTLRELSEAIGVSENTLERWEYRPTNPRPDRYPIIHELADFLGMPFNDVLDDIRRDNRVTKNYTSNKSEDRKMKSEESVDELIVRLAKEGKTFNDVVKESGRPTNYIRKVLMDNGVDFEHLVAPEKVKTNIPDLHTEIVIDKETNEKQLTITPNTGWIKTHCTINAGNIPDELEHHRGYSGRYPWFDKALKNLYKKTDYSTYVNVVILATGSRLFFETQEDRCRDMNKILRDIYQYCDCTYDEYMEIYKYITDNCIIVELD